MKSVEYDAYGPPEVLRVRDVPRPWPRRGEVLVRVRAAALNPKDVLIRSGKLRLVAGRRFPKQVGFDWAGEVVGVGDGVSGDLLGAAYYGMLDGYQGGACAEVVVARLAHCAPKPASLDFVQAAAVPLAASTALQALRDVAAVRPGMRVLVNGASGGVGVFAVQLAKRLGAHVTSTSSAVNLELCRRLGADVALDYRAADPLTGVHGGERFDVVLDVFGNRSLRDARGVLEPRGVYVTTVPKARVFLDVARTIVTSPKARMVWVRPRAADLAYLAEQVDAGRIVPVVAKIFPLDAIAAAEERVGSKHTGGKIVVELD